MSKVMKALRFYCNCKLTIYPASFPNPDGKHETTRSRGKSLLLTAEQAAEAFCSHPFFLLHQVS